MIDGDEIAVIGEMRRADGTQLALVLETSGVMVGQIAEIATREDQGGDGFADQFPT